MPIIIQHNPFATRFTRPGEIPFQLSEDENLNSIAKAFQGHRFVSQIVGPHGCGKTTLALALEPLLRESFLVRRISIRDVQSIHCDRLTNPCRFDARIQLLLIDGFERLPWLHRRMLLNHVRQQKIGLLITTHRRIAGVPVLYQVRPTLATLRTVSRQLAPGLTIEKSLLESVFKTNHGNIRECLMTLYNWFETLQSTEHRPT